MTKWKYDDKAVTGGKLTFWFVVFVAGVSAAFWGWRVVKPLVFSALGLQ